MAMTASTFCVCAMKRVASGSSHEPGTCAFRRPRLRIVRGVREGVGGRLLHGEAQHAVELLAVQACET